MSFDNATPDTIISTVNVTGLAGGENLVGIDFRPTSCGLFDAAPRGGIYVGG